MYVCVYMYIHVCVCMILSCVCVWVYSGHKLSPDAVSCLRHTRTHVYMFTYMYEYIMHLRVCVCLYVYACTSRIWMVNEMSGLSSASAVRRARLFQSKRRLRCCSASCWPVRVMEHRPSAYALPMIHRQLSKSCRQFLVQVIIAGRGANTKRLPTKLASNISKNWACRNYPLRWRPQGVVAGRRKAWWCLHTSCCLHGSSLVFVCIFTYA